MGGILFQYGTAVHLAFLTVAPLFLSAFCGPTVHAAVLAWLGLFGLMWIVMNPSPREGEWPRDARHRIGWELARNPFLIFCIVALVLSAVRAVNGGVAMAYDAAAGLWRLKGPFVSLLPGSVSARGVVPLAGCFGLAVVTLGARHALGARARFAFLFASALLAAGAVVAWRILPAHGLSARAEDPFGLGSLLGVYFILAVVAWVESWSSRFAILELLSAAAVSVLLFGLLTHASAFVFAVFALAGVLTVVVGVVLSVTRRSPSAWFRTAVALAIVAAPVALLAVGGIARSALWPLFPEGFAAVREAATSVALGAWKGSTRLGLGLGAYPLALGFFATPEDWRVLSVLQTAAPNGWVHFLFERGLLGVTVLAVGLGLLLRDGILRYVRAGAAWSLTAMHLLGPLALAAVAAVLFADCSYTALEALMPVGAALALTAAALPEASEMDHG